MTLQTITPIMANAVLAHVDDRRATGRRARVAAEARGAARRRARRFLRPRFAAAAAAGPAGAHPSP
jgi:hypothetical protein